MAARLFATVLLPVVFPSSLTPLPVLQCGFISGCDVSINHGACLLYALHHPLMVRAVVGWDPLWCVAASMHMMRTAAQTPSLIAICPTTFESNILSQEFATLWLLWIAPHTDCRAA